MRKLLCSLWVIGSAPLTFLGGSNQEDREQLQEMILAQYDPIDLQRYHRQATVEFDRELERKVKERLSRKGFSNKFTHLQVIVKDGVVTLFGEVRSANDRLEAEKRVGEVTKQIVNNIQVILVEDANPEFRYQFPRSY
jgi:BON domain